MTTLIRVSCPICSSHSDLPTDEILMDKEGDVIKLYYSCANCDSFVERQVAEKHLERLEKAGVFTVDEMASWIVEELEDEK